MNSNSQNAQALLNGLIQLIESRTERRRTRKSNVSSPTKSEEFKYPNTEGTKFYKFPQITSEFRFDCEGLRKLNPSDALDLLVEAGIINQLIVNDQRGGRMLPAESFKKKYENPNGVVVDVATSLTKKSKAVGSVDKALKEARKLTREQNIELVNKQLAQLGLPPLEMPSK